MIVALLRRRRAPSLYHRRLALGLFGSAPDRWPHRGRLPETWIGKAFHVAIGIVLGAMGAAIIIAWLAGG